MAGTTFACPKCGAVEKIVNLGYGDKPICVFDKEPLEEAGPWGKPLGEILRFAESERHSQARAGGNFYREIEYGLTIEGVRDLDPVSIVRDIHDRRADRATAQRNG